MISKYKRAKYFTLEKTKRLTSSVKKIPRNSVIISLSILTLAVLMFFYGLHAKYNKNQVGLGDILITVSLNGLNSVIFIIVFEVYVVNANKNALDINQGIEVDHFVKKADSTVEKIICMSTYFGMITGREEPSNQERVRKAITEALNRDSGRGKVKITIIVLLPSSKAALQRQEDINCSRDIKMHIRANEEEPFRFNESMFELFDLKYANAGLNTPTHFKILVYNSLPPFFLLQFDDDISIIHYLPTVSIQNGKRLDCKAGSKYSFLYEHSLDQIQDFCAAQNIHSDVEKLLQVELSHKNVEGTTSVWFLPYVQLPSPAERGKIYLYFDTKRKYHLNAYKSLKSLRLRIGMNTIRLSQTEYTNKSCNYMIDTIYEYPVFINNKNESFSKYNIKFNASVALFLKDEGDSEFEQSTS